MKLTDLQGDESLKELFDYYELAIFLNGDTDDLIEAAKPFVEALIHQENMQEPESGPS